MEDENEREQQEILYRNPMDRYGSAIIKLTNPKDNIDELENYFAGKVRDDNGRLIQMQEPLMNGLGIRNVIGGVKAFANQAGILSNLNDAEIKHFILDGFSTTLIKDLMINREKYGISNKVARDIILNSSRQVVFLISKRAVDADDKKFWAKIQHEFHQYINAPQKKGLMDRMNTWGKKNL